VLGPELSVYMTLCRSKHAINERLFANLSLSSNITWCGEQLHDTPNLEGTCDAPKPYKAVLRSRNIVMHSCFHAKARRNARLLFGIAFICMIYQATEPTVCINASPTINALHEAFPSPLIKHHQLHGNDKYLLVKQDSSARSG
jgi:hypothetical protein